MKKKWIWLIVFIFSATCFSLIHCIRVGSFDFVRGAVDIQRAKQLSNSDGGYFLVQQYYGGTGTGWLFIDTVTNAKHDVFLTGNIPSISRTFISPLLIKGTEENVEMQGQIYEGEKVEDFYTISVEAWEFVFPIERLYDSYDMYDRSRSNRWLYPRSYIDTFDVNNRDYIAQNHIAFDEK